MQRTDSGQSIIRVTTASTTLQIARRNELNHLIVAENDSTTIDDNNDNNKFNSDDIRIDFTTLKQNSSHSQTINEQSTIPINNNTLTNDMNNLDDNFISTTAIDETISTALTFEEQNQKSHFTTAKISLTESNVNSDKMEMTSINSSKFNQIIIDPENLTLNMKDDSFLSEKSQSPFELSSFSVFHLQTSMIPLSLSPLSASSTTTIATIDDNSLMEISPADKFLSNNDEKIIQSNSGNNKKSKIANNKYFYRKEINLNSTFAKNIEFDELDRKKIETNLVQNRNEQRQTKKAKTLIDKISTTHLPNNDLSSDSVELSSILGNQINNAFSNLIHLEKQQMGLSIPKYKNSATGIIFAQLPKQNGVNTVMKM
ncbi:unnamed protein product [Wuchereria bancrofti]|uniref:Uncharacterized protein n=1 Tax=Wuchereria bancrofti TaxID=6293 RepID=A0A3P7EDP3_WUCBA|nr:unnamed protein product [Wuchereria bancrofti]